MATLKQTEFFFQDLLSLNAGQKCCRMLQGEHSAILSTFIKLLFVIKIFILSIFEWPFYTDFTLLSFYFDLFSIQAAIPSKKPPSQPGTPPPVAKKPDISKRPCSQTRTPPRPSPKPTKRHNGLYSYQIKFGDSWTATILGATFPLLYSYMCVPFDGK